MSVKCLGLQLQIRSNQSLGLQLQIRSNKLHSNQTARSPSSPLLPGESKLQKRAQNLEREGNNQGNKDEMMKFHMLDCSKLQKRGKEE